MFGIPQTVAGMQIIVSDKALEASEERLFPASKNRSKRIHKKLIKRFGGEFRMVPCIWKLNGKLIMHPVRYQELKQQIPQAHP